MTPDESRYAVAVLRNALAIYRDFPSALGVCAARDYVLRGRGMFDDGLDGTRGLLDAGHETLTVLRAALASLGGVE